MGAGEKLENPGEVHLHQQRRRQQEELRVQVLLETELTRQVGRKLYRKVVNDDDGDWGPDGKVASGDLAEV